MIPSREEALKILDEMVENPNLKKHMLAVEAVMRAYAEKYGEDADKWGVAGLLHDADWEKYPKEHPGKIVEKLKEMGVDDEVIHAIASHGNNSDQYPDNHFETRDSKMDKTLYAADELSGFVVAVALVRPNKLDDIKPKSVKKKLKDKAFAAQVNRTDITEGAEELGEELSDHIAFVIEALKGIKNELFD